MMPLWAKQTLRGVGWLVFLPGMLVGAAYLIGGLVLTVDGAPDALTFGVVTLTLTLLTLGVGIVTIRYTSQSIRGKESPLLKFPAIWAMVGAFGLSLAMAWFVSANEFAPALFFPVALWTAATLPPLMAVSWFAAQNSAGLTWRRGMMALVGGGTVGVIGAIILQILIPVFFFALVFGLGDFVFDSFETLFEALAGADIARAMSSPAFIYAFIQLALIAPLTEELTKPLATLLIIKPLSKRAAFLVGAMAGVGFAALENMLYAGFGYDFWAGILLVRALGCAIHPVGAGVVALGWRDVLNGEPGAGKNWVIRYGLAVGMHALWNGGSLIVITLAGANFFGDLPPDVDMLGISAAGTTLALLIILGLTALWLGRTTAARVAAIKGEAAQDITFVLSDRGVAIWALACVVAIVPAGIAGLQILLR